MVAALVAVLATAVLVAGCGPSEDFIIPTAVPTAAAAPIVSPDPAPRVYVVERGDSMVSIAAAHEISLAELLALNAVPNPAVIEPGLRLVLPPLEAEPPVAEPAVVVPTVEPEASRWQPWVDRLPALPEQLEPAAPVLLALLAVGLAIVAVGAIAIGIQLIYALVAPAATGLSLAGGALQSVTGGFPRSSESDEGRRLFSGPRRWLPSFRSRSGGLDTAQFAPAPPAAMPLPASGPAVPPAPALPAAPAPAPPPPAPVAPIPAVAAPAPEAPAHRWPPVPPRPLSAPSVEAPSRAGGAAPPPTPAAVPAIPRRDRASAGRRFGLAINRAAVASSEASGRAGSRVVEVARSGAGVVARSMTHAATAPLGALADRREQRRRAAFRSAVEASTAARMRLGLRGDAETALQQSLEASLSKGWRLEAAWCLQLLAEEADRRADRALGELRRVRARELIREHALEESRER
jgi:hypothetical protein